MQRRKFLQSMGLLSVLPAPTLAETLLNPKTGVARLTAAPRLASEFYTAPYLLYPEKQALTVAWVTSKDCFSHVEYGTGDDLNQIAKSSHHGLIDAYTHVHKIRLSNLEPGRRYRYRVVSTENLGEENGEILFGDTRTSEIFEFDTLEQDPTEFNFMVFNDVHANSTIMHSLYNQAIERNTDLVFLNGDLVDSIEDEYNFCRQALNPLAQDFGHRIPLIYVRGNHECRGPHARNFNQYLHSENNNFYYSFSYGAVHFTVLDSGEYLSDSNPTTGDRLRFEPYRQQQADWLREEMKKEAFVTARYRIFLFHIPLGRSEVGPELERIWGAVMNEAKIDLVICGHTHTYKRMAPIAGRFNFHTLIGGGPSKEASDIETAIRVQVKETELTVVVTRADQTLVDEFTIAAG